MAEKKEPTLEEVQDENEALRCLLAHARPDIKDVDEVLDNGIAIMPRTGKMRYVGDVEPMKVETEKKDDDDKKDDTENKEDPEKKEKDDPEKNEEKEEKKEEPARRGFRFSRPATRPVTSRTSNDNTPDIDSMSVEDRAKHYKEVAQKEW